MKDYKAILHKYWGYQSFRGIQEDIINSIGSGKDTLGLMPTGGGKSITFQVPALSMKGICLVITPLIALMKDQVNNLRAKGIKAAAIYTGMTKEEIIVTLDNCIFGDYKFLYISPERLSNETFQTKLAKMPISFITVDEAHCISQWGYDFRPAYLQISRIRQKLPNIAILALTATATPDVVKDIQKQLEFAEENVYQMSFDRTNLIYVVRETENKYQELIHILNNIDGSAIIYTRSRKKTKEIKELLQEANIASEFYHAGITNEEKDARQQNWQQDKSRVMVATNAFGMGIDKPNVRVVIHIDVPDSIESYFQEAGRAGRDGAKAYAVLLYSPHDKVILKKRISDTFPDKTYIQQVYEHLCYYYQIAVGDGFNCNYEFNLEEFCHRFKHHPIQVISSLKILSLCGYINYVEEQESNSRIMFTLSRNELYLIHEQTTIIEQLLQVLLRSYTGLFSEYAYINEDQIGKKLGINRKQVYDYLSSLNQKHIIHYIPGKDVPHIIFTQKRVETNRVIISKDAYEKRKEIYVKRIQAMIEYATSNKYCRSRMLLQYFGESKKNNCQHCDVCLHYHKSGIKKGEYENIKNAILNTVSKNLTPCSPSVLATLQIPNNKLQTIISYLINEEEIEVVNGMIRINPNRINL